MHKAIFTFPGLLMALLFSLGFQTFSGQQQGEPWSEEQLIKPAEFAKMINEEDPEVLIYSIGPAGLIRNSVEIGPAKEEGNLSKLEKEVSELPRDANIVIYCGCCPFKDCPNIRPAFTLLNSMQFTNHRLLDIPQNLKVNWIDEGYPMSE